MYILDTETSSLQGGVCEIAWLHIDQDLNVLSEFHSFVNPERPIEEGARAVHGIADSDVEFAPVMAEIAEHMPSNSDLIGHNCLSGDTEFLAPSGWVRLDRFSGEPVMQWVAPAQGQTGELNFATPSAYIANNYTGPVISWSTSNHAGIYTPDHRMVVRDAVGGKPWEVKPAGELASSPINQREIPVAGTYSGPGLGLSDLQLRLLEATRADGSYGGVHASVPQKAPRFNLSKQRKLGRLKWLLAELGVGYSESNSLGGVCRISLHGCDTTDAIYSVLGQAKAYGSWVLRASVAEKLVILDEAAFWDGRKVDSARGGVQLYSASSAEVGWFQVLASTSGHKTSATLDMPNNRGYGEGKAFRLSRVSATNKAYVRLTPSKAQKPVVAEYAGTVYCFTVPSGAFLVRRNGRVWITGNCSFDMRMVKPHITPKRTLCTLELARTYVKGTTNHKLETLQKELCLPEQKSHSALGDVHTTRDLLAHILPLTGVSLEVLFQRQDAPRMLSRMTFGKHKGKTMTQVPREYRVWLLGQEIDKNLRYTLEKLKDI